jgi:hypothetical protein
MKVSHHAYDTSAEAITAPRGILLAPRRKRLSGIYWSRDCGQKYVPVNSIERGESAVTYKQKFTASEQKAHNRNIATKIHKEMFELRGRVDASPMIPGTGHRSRR